MPTSDKLQETREHSTNRDLWLVLLGASVAHGSLKQKVKSQLDITTAPKDLISVLDDIQEGRPGHLISWLQIRGAEMGDGHKAIDSIIFALQKHHHRQVMRDVAANLAVHQTLSLSEYVRKLQTQLTRLQTYMPQEIANDSSYQPPGHQPSD